MSEQIEKVIALEKRIEELEFRIKMDESLYNELANHHKVNRTLISNYRETLKALKTENLDKEIDRLIKEAIRKSNNESNNNIFKLTPEARALSEKFSANKGNLPWPVERGAIIQKFGLQPHPVVRTTKIQSVTDTTSIFSQ